MVEKMTTIRKQQGISFSSQSVNGNILQKVIWYFYLQSLNILWKLEDKGNLSILYSVNQIFMFCFDFDVVWCVETSGTRILRWLCQKAVSLCRSHLRKVDPSTSPVPSLAPSWGRYSVSTTYLQYLMLSLRPSSMIWAITSLSDKFPHYLWSFTALLPTAMILTFLSWLSERHFCIHSRKNYILESL